MSLSIVKHKSLVRTFPIRELFYEDFQTPAVVDVSGYDAGVVPTRWLRSDTGFGNDRIGLNNGDVTTDWVTQPGKTQGLDPNYTNSGACTKKGEVSPVNIGGVKYRLIVEAAYDKAILSKNGLASGAIRVILCALEDAIDRQDFAAGATNFSSRALVDINTSVTDNGLINILQGEYTTDPITDAAWDGRDLAVAIDGATSHGIVVSVKVEQEAV